MADACCRQGLEYGALVAFWLCKRSAVLFGGWGAGPSTEFSSDLRRNRAHMRVRAGSDYALSAWPYP